MMQTTIPSRGGRWISPLLSLAEHRHWARASTLFNMALAFTLLANCGGGEPRQRASSAPSALRIGLLMDAVDEERWQRDRDLFVARAKQLRADVLVESGDRDDARQAERGDALLAQGIKVLVVVPHDDEKAAVIVEAAKRKNVPVISYDRLIRNADVDLYVSFNNVKVGEMQAQYLLGRAPKGNYILIGGAPTDNNARLIREGQMAVLEPAIARREIRVVADPWTKDWLASEAQRLTEEALQRAKNNVVAVAASNDITAGGAIAALEQRQLAGKVMVSGQDANLDAVRRIVAGTQSMTVYKPLTALARLAADSAVSLAKGETIQAVDTLNNGRKDVPALLVEPITVDKDNLDATIIRDGYHKREAIYAGSPGAP